MRQGPVRLHLQEGTCSEPESMAGIRGRGWPKARGGAPNVPDTHSRKLDVAFKAPSKRKSFIFNILLIPK